MIARYTRPAMGRIWSDENKFRCWLTVETAASQALARFGLVPQAAADAIRDRGNFTVARIDEIEAEVRHDVIAFTTAVAEHIDAPPTRRKILPLAALRPHLHRCRRHRAVPPAQRSLRRLIRAGIVALSRNLKNRALEFKHTPIIGRTHGVHAEPTTFGLKLLLWYSEMQRNLAALRRRRRRPPRRQALRRRRHLRPSQAGARRRHLRRTRPHPRRRRHADRPARSPRRLHRHARHPLLARWTRSPPKFATCSAPRSARPRSSSAKSKKAPPRCRTSATPSPASRSPASPASSAPTPRPPSRTSPSGTSATSPTPPPSASSSPTPPSSPTISSTKPSSLIAQPPRLPRRACCEPRIHRRPHLQRPAPARPRRRRHVPRRRLRLVQSHAMRAWKEDLVFRDEIARVPAIAALLTPAQLAAAFDYTRQLANVDAIFSRVLEP